MLYVVTQVQDKGKGSSVLWELTGGGSGGWQQRDVLSRLLLHRSCRELILLLAPLVRDKEPDGAALGGKAERRWAGWRAPACLCLPLVW